VTKPRFNGDFYCKTIEEWENKVVPERCLSDKIGWSVRLLPVTLACGLGAGLNWRLWVGVLAVTYVCAVLFTFLEEINENLRFVRHQMRAFRQAVRRVHEQVGMYKDPVSNFTVNDALQSLDREWEDPRPDGAV
jgi:hypothetical protein